MTDASAGQQLFDLWKKQLDESAQSWAQMLGRLPAAPPDPAGFWWKPMFEQGLQQWAKVLAQAPLSPDLAGQWKQAVDQSIEAWSRALSQIMGTEAFAQAMGKTLEQWLAGQGPARKAADQAVEQGLQAFNLPSRTQVANVARQIIDLEERIDRMEDMLSAIARRLEGLTRPAEPAAKERT